MSRQLCEPGPTQLDLAHALAYADQQIAYMKCTDSDIIDKVCGDASGQPAGGGTCIQWVEDTKDAFFPKPENYYINSCAKDDDCYQGTCNMAVGKCECITDTDCSGDMQCLPDPNQPSSTVCGYSPGFVASGHCIFNNETACVAQGELPYECNCGPNGNDVGTCVYKSSPNLNKGYTEWHTNPDGSGQCVLGNFSLRQWCENPCSRCQLNPSTNTYPSECTGGVNTRGVTTVPPFYYDVHKGNCYITHDYCNEYELDFNKGKCTEDADCQEDDSYCDGTHCTSPTANCVNPKHSKIARMLVGRTLFYIFRGGFKNCPYVPSPLKNSENYENPKIEQIEKLIATQFNSTPKIACSLYNPKQIINKKKIKEDFGGRGISLYIFRMTNNKIISGFVPEEIEKIYPNILEKYPDGTTMICIDRDELKDDKYMKRIYLTLNSGGWIAENVLSAVERFKKK